MRREEGLTTDGSAIGKGDPPGTSASAKELQRDRELDARLRKEPPLPAHLQEHARRPSRVDVEVLYADSPIDASLLSLYLHQNYTQYCGDLAECAALADTLSWIDANGAESVRPLPSLPFARPGLGG